MIVKTPLGLEITFKQALDAAAKSVKRTFPLANCSEKCLKAQLGDYYKKLQCKPKSNSGASGGDGDKGGVGTTNNR